jgi:HEAT repeat protein/beta-lactamase regulating signal transducer with metallopeptidase domain
MNAHLLDGTFGLVIEGVLKGTLLLLLLFLASPLLHRLSAGTRALAWGFGLVALTALPFLSRMVPWKIGVIPVVAAAPATGPAITKVEGASTSNPSTVHAPTTSGPRNSGPSTGGEQGTEVASVPVTSDLPVDWAQLLLFTWVAGTVVVLTRLYLGRRTVRRFAARATPATEREWVLSVARATDRLGLADAPEVYFSEDLPLPVTTGVRRPIVLLPTSASEWPAERRDSVVLHELAHIQRHDLFTHTVARFLCALWWFHPLAWRALGRFRAESERAADDLVLASGRRASDYAQDLLAVVQGAGRASAPALALAMAQRSDFEGRLLAILEPGASRRGVTPMTAIPMILAVSLFTFPLAALGPNRVATPATPETPAPSLVVAPAAKAMPAVPAAPAANVEFDRDAAVRYPLSGRAAALAAALSDPVADVRMAAVSALGRLGDTTVVNALINALTNDTDDGVRKAAAWALGELENSTAVPALSTALRRDRNIEVRRNAAWALGQIEDAGAVDALGAALSDPDEDLKNKAVWALGQIEDAKAVPFLVPLLRDRDPDVRAQTAWALGQIESKDAVEGLSRAVTDTNTHVRSQVAWALGQIEDASSVPALKTLLKDADPDVRQQAAWALGQVESKAATDALIVALKDSDADVRQQAAWALGQIEDVAALPGLEAAITDSDIDVRKMAIWAIGQLNASKAPAGLLKAFEDANAEVRKNAAWAAGQIEDPAAIPGLTKLLTDSDREVQRTALWALGQIDDPRALDGLTKLLQSTDPEMRRRAAEAMGRDH